MWQAPTSTYRLQFHAGFRFSDAAGVIPYLADLGVSHVYSSPFLAAAPGSTHGYDIVDHDRLNPEIGSEDEYAAFAAALREHGLGQILDFVPNHMGIDPHANLRWRDVLESGPSSLHARFFDIDWKPTPAQLENKVLLPILGDQYGMVLERGELAVHFEEGWLSLRYFERDLPLDPHGIPLILEHGIDELRERLGAQDPQLAEYLSITTAFRNLPAYTETDAVRMEERQREKEVTKDRFRRLCEASPAIREHVERSVESLNGRPEDPRSFDRLHALLEQQPYRLAYWRTASHEINYRRFFDVDQLAGIRMEDPVVFDATHGLILRLVGEGTLDGLRLDHIDGLFDPQGYLERLRAAVIARQGERIRAEPEITSGGFSIVVEKILSGDETLSGDWPVEGTSGYDFMNDLNRLFVERRSRRVLERIYRRFSGMRESFADVVHDAKKLIMATSMASELNVLADAVDRLSERDRRTRDFTRDSLREALRELVAAFPIYRTYVSPRGHSERDLEVIDTALRLARQRNATMEPSIFEFLRSILVPDLASDPIAADRLQLAMRFQQYTGPVQAKGLEDTSFYRHVPLASLNEVGGDPDRFGAPARDFHQSNQVRRARWPRAMLATATHDTKRGEDGRARLNVLSELPEVWGRHLTAWARINQSNRTRVNGEPAPDRNDEYLLYQTLLSVWPPEAVDASEELVERIVDYMRKVAREAKRHTSWLNQNEPYEKALTRFIEQILRGPSAERFRGSFLPFQQRIARLGRWNSLSQVLLKIVSPGAPDFYQGSELWDLSLVDPDNRRPVDYDVRRQYLAELAPALEDAAVARKDTGPVLRELIESWPDGRLKLFLTTAGLRLRRRLDPLFIEGSYEALDVHGERARGAVGILRRQETHAVIALAARFLSAHAADDGSLPRGEELWRDTTVALPEELAGRVLVDVLRGRRVQASTADGRSELRLATTLTDGLPVALIATTG